MLALWLLGVAYMMAAERVEELRPGSYLGRGVSLSVVTANSVERLPTLIYFSFVTLTMLVGLHISKSSSRGA